MLPNASVWRSFADYVLLLGEIPADRVHAEPRPGLAIIDDWIAVSDRGDSRELFNGTLADHANN